MRSSILQSLACSSGLALLITLGAASCASERSITAPMEVQSAPVPSEGAPSSPKPGPQHDLPAPSTPTSEQIEKLEKALGDIQAIPVPIHP